MGASIVFVVTAYYYNVTEDERIALHVIPNGDFFCFSRKNDVRNPLIDCNA